jgi:transcription-repair coupling factor (superfamily II helicase)
VQKNRQIKLAGQDRLRIENIPAEFAALTQTIRHAMRQLA